MSNGSTPTLRGTSPMERDVVAWTNGEGGFLSPKDHSTLVAGGLGQDWRPLVYGDIVECDVEVDSAIAPVKTSEATTPCPKCSAPCKPTVHARGGDWGWGTTDRERTTYAYASPAASRFKVEEAAPGNVAGTEAWGKVWEVVDVGTDPDGLFVGFFISEEAANSIVTLLESSNVPK